MLSISVKYYLYKMYALASPIWCHSFNLLIWRPIYRQPVYVGIYLTLLLSTFSTCALKLSIGKKKHNLKVSVMNKRLQGRFREVIYNYTLYYFVYMYTQICDENALIWGFPRRMFRPPPTWNFGDVNNQYSYSYVKGAKRNSRCVADSKVA